LREPPVRQRQDRFARSTNKESCAWTGSHEANELTDHRHSLRKLKRKIFSDTDLDLSKREVGRARRVILIRWLATQNITREHIFLRRVQILGGVLWRERDHRPPFPSISHRVKGKSRREFQRAADIGGGEGGICFAVGTGSRRRVCRTSTSRVRPGEHPIQRGIAPALFGGGRATLIVKSGAPAGCFGEWGNAVPLLISTRSISCYSPYHRNFCKFF
jgi:hypothetical protein